MRTSGTRFSLPLLSSSLSAHKKTNVTHCIEVCLLMKCRKLQGGWGRFVLIHRLVRALSSRRATLYWGKASLLAGLPVHWPILPLSALTAARLSVWLVQKVCLLYVWLARNVATLPTSGCKRNGHFTACYSLRTQSYAQISVIPSTTEYRS
jgi:hypothetical protein